ncbi:DUF1304 domain-containing protein [Lactobacillus hamsteri]|uniref:Membrane protein n=1 Tax=Lactobacillus hamsteri DSM 5661 = JCM 6256 TaxID=1423754 RepID=A0A0R1YET0_9LACO|nr:DUF1304 domain-containing protein [Lactobacillus hamsteri]KRM40850.1 membrane protein [Lactobacillus hamsteri DSM 5661 = JCM 6256]
MHIITTIGYILTILVGIEHIGICLLEIFASPEKQAQAFDMDISFTKQKAARISMANQGIYNGILGLLLIVVYFIFPAATLIKVWQLLLGMIVIVAIFGGFTATKKIFVLQMLPALIALILLSI